MHSERGLDRLVNFSDAVAAIAITLIILPLVDSARDVEAESVAEFLHANAGPLAAAALSFVVIAAFWRQHHRLFESVTDYSRVVVWFNFVWLSSIVFLPLPTVLLVQVDQSDDRLASVLYIGTMLVSMIALAIIESSARHDGLLTDEARDRPRRRLLPGRWEPTAVMALALLIAATVPGVGISSLLVLFVQTPIALLRRRRSATPSP